MSSQPPKEPNLDLIQTLHNAMEENPLAATPREILIQHLSEVGWIDAAEDIALDLLRIEPSNTEAKKCLQSRGRLPKPRQNTTRSQPSRPAQTHSPVLGERLNQRKRNAPKPLPLPRTAEERKAMEKELTQGYLALLTQASTLHHETSLIQTLQLEIGTTVAASISSSIQDLKDLSSGRISSVVSLHPPLSARAVARKMEADISSALEIVISDLEETIRWRRTEEPNNDSIREALAKRTRALVAALPDTPWELQEYPVTALMHVEHEELGRAYVNDETMYGDEVSNIPREKFWVTEDGYAWDMEELAAALTANRGVMRNPLSKEMFTPNDIRAIISHHMGKKLAALQMEQSELSQGVREATIDKLDALSKILLGDLSDDQIASRKAIDDFMAYVAILPQSEQRAIDELRVPAKDSHTGQSFDCTVGEAVRDAQANKICLHKTGDLIGQAAVHLRQSNKRRP